MIKPYLVSKFLDNESLTNDQIKIALDLIISQLTCWFYGRQDDNTISCFQERLQANAQVLRINYINELKKFIDSFIFKISPTPCLEYLELLETILNVISQKYQRELDEFCERERSARHAYNVLIDLNFQSRSQNNKTQEFNSLIRALSHIYHNKMEIEVYNLSIQILAGMVRIIQHYIDDLILTSNLLKNVQNQLDMFDVDQGLTLFVKGKYYSFQDPDILLQDLEIELGCSINQWGIKYDINSELILNKLLNKISDHSSNILASINQELYI